MLGLGTLTTVRFGFFFIRSISETGTIIRSSSPRSICAIATSGRQDLEEDPVELRLRAAGVVVVALDLEVLVRLVLAELEGAAPTRSGSTRTGASASWSGATSFRMCSGRMLSPAKSPIVSSQVASGFLSVILTV